MCVDSTCTCISTKKKHIMPSDIFRDIFLRYHIKQDSTSNIENNITGKKAMKLLLWFEGTPI